MLFLSIFLYLSFTKVLYHNLAYEYVTVFFYGHYNQHPSVERNIRGKRHSYFLIYQFHRVDISPDQTTIACGLDDGTLCLYDIQGSLKSSYKGHSDRVHKHYTYNKQVHGCAFSHSGKNLISSSKDKLIKLWALEGFQLIRVFVGHEYWVIFYS